MQCQAFHETCCQIFLFDILGVNNQIHYGTFDHLCDMVNVINSRWQVRSLVDNIILSSNQQNYGVGARKKDARRNNSNNYNQQQSRNNERLKVLLTNVKCLTVRYNKKL